MDNIIFKHDYAILRWNSRNKKRYISLGYKFTKMKDEFKVKIKHLTPNSWAVVQIVCSECGAVRPIEFYALQKYQSSDCARCNRDKQYGYGNQVFKDLAGKRFSRLVVLSLAKERRNKRTVWWCKCDCGNKLKVRGCHLVSGHTTSCGCYVIELMTGDTNPVYNHDLTDEERIERRKVPGYKQWAKDVKKKDNYSCVVCGDSSSGNLVSHHLDAWLSFPEKRFDLDNGVCLCKDCHYDFHGQYGNGDNTKEQFIEFFGLKNGNNQSTILTSAGAISSGTT